MDKVYFGIGGQFGDIVMQEPSLRKFIENNPNTKIVMGANKKYAGALELYKGYHPNIIDFVEWEGYTNNWPTSQDLEYINSNLKECPKFTPYPKQHTRKDWALYHHQVKEIGLMYGILINDLQIKFQRPDIEKLPDGLEFQTVCISLFPNHPNGGVKSINMETVNKIVKLCTDRYFKVIHLNGPNEPEVANAHKLNGSYMDSVKALLKSKLLITCDTGMSWVASGFQHKTIGLYAWEYNPYVTTSVNWQPINPNARYLEARRANQIPFEKIKELICQAL